MDYSQMTREELILQIEELSKENASLKRQNSYRPKYLNGASHRVRYSREKKLEDELKYKLQLERLISDISTSFIITKADRANIDELITNALGKLGEFVGADRCYIYKRVPGELDAIISHKWSKYEENMKNNLQGFKVKELQYILDKLLNSDFLYISNTNKLPASAQTEKALFSKLNTKSTLNVPMISNGEIIGILGFSTVTEEKQWGKNQIELIKIASQLFLNILERKQSLDSLQKSEERNKALVSAIPDLIFRIKKDGMIIDIKTAKCFPLRIPYREYIGKDICVGFSEGITKKMRKSIYKAVLTGNIQTFEVDHVIDNRRFIEEVRVNSSGDDELIVLIRDITEKKQVENKIAEARNKISQAQELATMGIITTSLGHEISQPLNAIKVASSGILYLHRHGYKQNIENVIQEVERILQETIRIEKVINNIKAYMKKDFFDFTKVDINQVIRNSTAVLDKFVDTGGVVVTTELAEDLPLINANSTQLEQVFINILINAIQVFRNLTKEQKQINFKTYYQEGVIAEIADTGTGIEEDIKENIFEPFYTTKKPSDNLGLGLSVVDFIITSHKGSIEVFNNHLGGATFKIKLPVIR